MTREPPLVAAARRLSATSPERAADMLEAAIAAHPTSLAAHWQRATVNADLFFKALMRDGRRDEERRARALAAYEHALTLLDSNDSETRVEAHRKCAMLLSSDGHSEQQRSHLRAALALKPSLGTLHHELGASLLGSGSSSENNSVLDEAISAFEQAAELQPIELGPSAACSLGVARTRQQQHESAERSLRTCLETAAPSQLFYAGLSTERPDGGGLAASLLERALDVESPGAADNDQTRTAAFYAIGRMRTNAGDLAGARQTYDRAVREGVWRHPLQRPGYMWRSVTTSAPWPTAATFAADDEAVKSRWRIVEEVAKTLEAHAAGMQEELSTLLPSASGDADDEGDCEEGDASLLASGGVDTERLAEAAPNALEVDAVDQPNVTRWRQWVFVKDGRPTTLLRPGAAEDANAAPAIAKTRLAVEAAFAAAGALGEKLPRGSVELSVLHPQTRIRAHCGPTNHRLRLHLGLSIPEESSLVVAGEARRWREGGTLIFDDSYEHQVWNNASNRARVVLIFDTWHPAMPPAAREAVREALWSPARAL